MKRFWLFASCLLVASCGDPAKPVTMIDKRLIAGLRTCGIDPADAAQVSERVNGRLSNYLVFSRVAPYPEPKMRCLARVLVRADYGIRQSGDTFERAYQPAWKAEFDIHVQGLATSWLQEHRPGQRPPRFVKGGGSLSDFARELEEFCGAKPNALSLKGQSLTVPLQDDEPQAECLSAAALAANLDKHGFAVQTSSYE
ncbi:hypothetical protein [Sphingomonas xinjiangensis]|uniref:Lipoprotein n=1 Tax=Sphingomonas xinjiangensis TaxID=643568 RepID=A0A840YTY2_9SPHN|nr:hypothetical protein [Sphingomonas xinjiangensis]MBB5713102.1 hypothetical protein [Sphingomonas xinjiangensis]